MTECPLPKKVAAPARPQKWRLCPAHRAWVWKHHCSVPGCATLPVECAHIRIGTDGGIALKPSDRWIISLCAGHHGEQHQLGERRFQTKYRFDLIALAKEFARKSPHFVKLNSSQRDK